MSELNGLPTSTAPPSYPAVLGDLVDGLAALPGVERVVLFGSRARGDAAPRSDIDLAIAAPGMDPVAWSRLEELVERAQTLLVIDLVRLETAGETLHQAIHRDGRILFQREVDAA